MEISKLAVIGAGAMGHGIAQVAAMHGFEVVMVDISEEALRSALERVRLSLERSVERGRLSREDADSVLSRIKTDSSLDRAVVDADVVIESVFEDKDVKANVLRRAEECAERVRLIATNTSSIPINELAEALSRPERFLGMHFFNPPQVIELVEVILGDRTSSETKDLAVSLIERLGKTPVLVKRDVPGFVVNRVIARLFETVSHLVARGTYGIEEVDSALKFRLGMPMGAFELADYVGLDVLLAIMKVLTARDSTFRYDQRLEEKVRSGELGLKSRKGFYAYPPTGAGPALSPEKGKNVNLVRLLAPAINEAARLIEDQVAGPGEVDKALRLGLNLPTSLFAHVRNFKREEVLRALEELEVELGKGYRPVRTLFDLLDTGSTTDRNSFEELIVKVDPPIGWVILNRPQRLNAVSPKMLDELEVAIKMLEKEASVRVLVLRGSGERAFSVGADVFAFAETFNEVDRSKRATELSEKYHRVTGTIESCPKPVIAAINGFALGGGLELALACDLRLASERAEVGLPEIRLGLIPGGGGTQKVVRSVGVMRAMEIVLLGERIKADEAYKIGLINKVVSAEKFEEEVREYALRLAELPPIALGYAKLLVRNALDSHISDGLRLESILFGKLFNTKDLVEGISAFLAKRRPEFKGE
ncbi:MAG: 3-hydroxyacyl-CoA dehydrogenase NAD-binding domain-containing protein [Aigarchaeota archaeon]|nr:3-hydroxyacyl-CoA dehydrogenase NAD-binding domain-containing protein [Aigarchaeota archaeon]MDW8092133.1 3-hydroxyacyl-CoA dehydrogenase NAD-binding domain-containing protein [Nitrososphaerota archaeon]